MHAFHGYDSFIATYDSGDYSNLKYTPGLRIEVLPQRTGKYYRDSYLWLKNNAKRIDVLNLYHTHKQTLRQALVYKFFNPHGKIYLKLDGWPLEYISKLLGYRIKISKNPLRLWLNHIMYKWLFKHCDFVSTEFEKCAEVLSRDFGVKIGCVANPFNPNELQDLRPFSERPNTIIYVGRISRAKGSHTLLESFAKVSPQIPDWNLKLVGKVVEQDIEDSFRENYPGLRERVIFTGQVASRCQITELYRNSKVFAFPSRSESFGIALSEAMTHGCFAVTTNIPSSSMLTDNFRFALGSDVDDVDGLAKNLLYACTHEAEIETLALEGMNATRTRCDLKRCSEIIAEGLK